jgi:hypothetical protein
MTFSLRKVLGLLLLVGLCLRTAGALWHAREGFTIPDESAYLHLGTMIDRHGAFRDSLEATPEIIRGPTYPAFLAATFHLFGEDMRGPILLQGILSALAAILLAAQLHRTLLRAGADHRLSTGCATLAAVLLALSPISLLYDRVLLSESLTTSLLVLATIAWLRAREPGGAAGVGWALLAGAILGVLTLAKPAMLLLPLALLLAGLIFPGPLARRRMWLLGSLTFVTTVLVMLPWSARNLRLTGRPIPVAIGSGCYLYAATLPVLDSGTIDVGGADQLLLNEYLDPSASPARRIAVDDEFRRRGIARIKAAPGEYLGLSVRRVIHLWASSHASMLVPLQVPRTARAAGVLITGFIVLAALLAPLLVSPAVRSALSPLSMIMLYVTAVHTPIGSGARYAVPGWPAVLCLASVALFVAWQRRGRTPPLFG